MPTHHRETMLRRFPCPYRTQVPLSEYTTFRIGGPADVLAEPSDARQLQSLYRLLVHEKMPHFYLGHGSNLIISDEGFRGTVIRATGNLCRMERTGSKISAGPGARLLDLTALAASLELTGMEPLCGIPGSVGGGLYMNAGAYGGEISDTLVDVDVVTADGELATLARDDIRFSYRNAPALQSAIVLESRYRLNPGDRMSIYREMRRVWKLRRAKQPLEFPSAGSIFKRPPGDFAGRLIEEIGGKGTRIGGAMVSPKHAGFFINVGGATAADVTALIRLIRRRVFERFQIMLELEVKAVGFADDPFAIET